MLLTNETIDIISEKITEMYQRSRSSKKDTVRARLLLEETLIKYQNRFGEDIEVSFHEYRIFSQTRFSVKIKSPSFDPFTLEENPMAFMLESVMSSFEGSMPSWKYRNLENEILFTIRDSAKFTGLEKIVIAVAASLAVSIPARLMIPSETLLNIVDGYIQPLSDAYAGLFCIMAVLLTFFAVTLSIVKIGDLTTVGMTAGQMLKRFMGMSVILVLAIVLPNIFGLEYSQSTSLSIATKSIYDVLIGFIPSNIVSPFLNFNSVHIMIIGAMFGFSLLSMGQKGDTTVKLFGEINFVSVLTNSFLNRFIYLYVALKLFSFMTTSDFTDLKGAGKLVAMVLLGDLVIMAFYVVYTCISCKIPFKTLMHNLLPIFIICLSSANFGAAFSTLVDSLIALKSYDDTSALAINMGSVLFRPACTLTFIFSSIMMASLYNVEISIVWMATCIILSLILVAAVPNIPGISVSVITLLFAQLGLPSEAVAMMIAINAPLQFVTVAVDTCCLTAECAIMANKAIKSDA